MCSGKDVGNFGLAKKFGVVAPFLWAEHFTCTEIHHELMELCGVGVSGVVAVEIQ
jgi:hypothetical protein